MLIALYSLLPIFLAFAGGLNLKKVVKNSHPSFFDKISMLSLYLLLLFMGATVGEIPDIKGQLSVAGFNALIIASGTSVVTFITLVAVGKLSGEKRLLRNASHLQNSHSDSAVNFSSHAYSDNHGGGRLYTGVQRVNARPGRRPHYIFASVSVDIFRRGKIIVFEYQY